MKQVIFQLLFLTSLISVSAQEVDSIIDIRDGQIYKVVKIGEQWWMQENLNIGSQIDGSQDASNNGAIEKYCYEDNSNNCETYGGLYQWDEIMDYNNSNEGNSRIIRGGCPAGWHLPSKSEWDELADFLGGWAIAGGKMKDTGMVHWASPNRGATNESGFTALPGGYRNDSGKFNFIGSDAYFWSSSEPDEHASSYYYMYYNSYFVATYDSSKTYGYSVRCLRDSSQYSYLNILDINLTTITQLDFTFDNNIDTLIVINSSVGKTINISSIYTTSTLTI